MKPVVSILAQFSLCFLLSISAVSNAQNLTIPDAPREFRGVWIATVANIDFPSQRTLNGKQQQHELTAMLDKCSQLRINAVIFQVRPVCDAVYQSTMEPWSEFLTGAEGRAPVPAYDPLAFIVEEAHSRGIEVHAWFNPYRAGSPEQKSAKAPNHVSRTMPEVVKSFGGYMWLDPGEKKVQDHVYNVIMDVTRRYDIDGVHFDDYFYPYRSYNPGKDFPDEATFAAFKKAGGTMSLEDWRRENVNTLVRRVQQGVRAAKPHLLFGISPFGVWRPGNPPGITGMDSYNEIFNDSRKWLSQGWVDYLAPQLYWKPEEPGRPYAKLLKWWVDQNVAGRHVWPGLIPASRSATDIVTQVQQTRRQPGASGNIHFSMKPLMQNKGGVSNSLATAYAGPALVPQAKWLSTVVPMPPIVNLSPGDAGNFNVTWQAQAGAQPWLWGLYAQIGGSWKFEVLPAGQTSYSFPKTGAGVPTAVAVSAIDRSSNESTKALPQTPRTVAGGR